MARLRIFQIEIEDAGEGAVNAALSTLHRQIQLPTPPHIVEQAPPVLLPAASEVSPSPAKWASRDAPRKLVESSPLAPKGDTIVGKILLVLGKGPKSSIELTDVTGLEMSQVAPATSYLKGKGLIEGRNDPSDETRRWFIVKAK